MDAPYQARDDAAAMRAGSGGVSICGMMPRKIVEVKCRLLHVFKVVGLQGMKDKQMKRECYKLRIKSPDPSLLTVFS